jgi:hypothetical protein
VPQATAAEREHRVADLRAERERAYTDVEPVRAEIKRTTAEVCRARFAGSTARKARRRRSAVHKVLVAQGERDNLEQHDFIQPDLFRSAHLDDPPF